MGDWPRMIRAGCILTLFLLSWQPSSFGREAAPEISQTRSVWSHASKALRPERTLDFHRPAGTELFGPPTWHLMPG